MEETLIKKKKHTWIIVLIIAIVIIVATAGVIVFMNVKEERARQREQEQLIQSYNEKMNSGNMYLSSGTYMRAIACFEEAILIDPKNNDAYIALGDAYIAMTDNVISEAVDSYNVGELEESMRYYELAATYCDESITTLTSGLDNEDSDEIRNRIDEMEKRRDTIEEGKNEVIELDSQVPFFEANNIPLGTKLLYLSVPWKAYFRDNNDNAYESPYKNQSLTFSDEKFRIENIELVSTDEDMVTYKIEFYNECYQYLKNGLYDGSYSISYCPDIYLADYYTGTIFPQIINYDDMTSDTSSDFSWKNKRYTIEIKDKTIWANNEFYYYDAVTEIATEKCRDEYIVTVPKDYDGLVLFFTKDGASNIPIELIENGSIYEDTSIRYMLEPDRWGNVYTADDYICIRVTDMLDRF